MSLNSRYFWNKSKGQIFPLEFYNKLKNGDEFRWYQDDNLIKEQDYQMTTRDYISYCQHPMGYMIMSSQMGCNICICQEDFDKGYEHLMNIWEE